MTKNIQTENLLLRNVLESDLDRIIHILANPHLVRYMSMPLSYSKTAATVDFISDKTQISFAICLRDASVLNELIGVVQVSNAALSLGALTQDEITSLYVPWTQSHATVTLAIWIAQEHWGKGYATECLSTCIAYLKKEGVATIMLHIATDNIVSISLATKLGFSQTQNVLPHLHNEFGTFEVVEYILNLF
jgi:RimJ/RimL family protein N-acetyltransferase